MDNTFKVSNVLLNNYVLSYIEYISFGLELRLGIYKYIFINIQLGLTWPGGTIVRQIWLLLCWINSSELNEYKSDLKKRLSHLA